MNRFSRILAAIAAMATMSCNANDSRTTVRYSILEDPETTPAEIKSWEAYAFVFSGGKCTYSGYWKELSDLVAIDADKDDVVTVVAVESMTNLGLPLLEPGGEAGEYRFVTDDFSSAAPRIWSSSSRISGNDDTLFQFLTPVCSEISVSARNAPDNLNAVELHFQGGRNSWYPYEDIYGAEDGPFELAVAADGNANVVFPPSSEDSPCLSFSSGDGRHVIPLSAEFAVKKACSYEYIVDFGEYESRNRVTVSLISHSLLAPSVIIRKSFAYDVPGAMRDHYAVSFSSASGSGTAAVHKALCSDARKHGSLWNDWDNSRKQRDTMSFSIIDTDFPVKMRIRKNGGSFSRVEVRPSIYGIEPVLCGDNTVEITLPSADKGNVSVEFDGDRYHNLFIYASEPDTGKPEPDDPAVKYFGPGIHQPGTINL